MNTYLLLAAGWVLSLLAVGWEASNIGADRQKVRDQAIFDRYKQDIQDQTTAVNELLLEKQKQLVELVRAREALNRQLETTHEMAQRDTASLRKQLAGERLRFPPGTLVCGEGGRGSPSTGADPASHTASSARELPAEIERGLRELAYDADTLRDDYALLYSWAHQPSICVGASP